jgi:hypothetical protein
MEAVATGLFSFFSSFFGAASAAFAFLGRGATKISVSGVIKTAFWLVVAGDVSSIARLVSFE